MGAVKVIKCTRNSRLLGSEDIDIATGSPPLWPLPTSTSKAASLAKPSCNWEEVDDAQGGGKQHIHQGLVEVHTVDRRLCCPSVQSRCIVSNCLGRKRSNLFVVWPVHFGKKYGRLNSQFCIILWWKVQLGFQRSTPRGWDVNMRVEEIPRATLFHLVAMGQGHRFSVFTDASERVSKRGSWGLKHNFCLRIQQVHACFKHILESIHKCISKHTWGGVFWCFLQILSFGMSWNWMQLMNLASWALIDKRRRRKAIPIQVTTSMGPPSWIMTSSSSAFAKQLVHQISGLWWLFLKKILKGSQGCQSETRTPAHATIPNLGSFILTWWNKHVQSSCSWAAQRTGIPRKGCTSCWKTSGCNALSQSFAGQ